MKYRQAKKILKSRDDLWNSLPENKKDIARNTVVKRETRVIHVDEGGFRYTCKKHGHISDSYYEEYCNTAIDD